MKVQLYIVLTCICFWALVSLMVPRVAVEILLGMAAPLLLALATLILVERTYSNTPDRLTALMTRVFVIKMLFYAVYVTVVVGFYSLQVLPFAVSFTFYFIGLHLTEALYFQALFRTEQGPGVVEKK